MGILYAFFYNPKIQVLAAKSLHLKNFFKSSATDLGVQRHDASCQKVKHVRKQTFAPFCIYASTSISLKKADVVISTGLILKKNQMFNSL